MVNRLRSGSLAGSAALVLVLAVQWRRPWLRGASSDTSAAFVDVDGDGVDDACQEAATENTEAATAAFEAADLNGDGEISVSEAAQSGWTGGTNCNHGGYVSQVAQTDDEACDAPETGDTGETGDAGATGETGDTGDDETADPADCSTDEATDEATEDAAPAEEETCEEVAAPELDPATRHQRMEPWRLGLVGRELRGHRRQELQPRRRGQRSQQGGQGSSQGGA